MTPQRTLPTILIADDNAMIRSLLVRLVEREGYQIVEAANGTEALALVHQVQPDLVLLDVTMPDIDGYAVCRRIKQDDHTALIPVTMLTVLDDPEHRRRGIEAGADDFLTKPVDEELLRVRIRSQLRTKQLTDQLERTESVIFSLALAVEAKDYYTEGHIRRLANYSEQLALTAGMTPDEARIIRYGGFLHDIGKIGVDDAILRKPGPLTRAEYQQIKDHPEWGARIIEPMRFAAAVSPIVLGHHESWDGSGYPRGLRAEAIPVGARIVAIVDAFDAMTTNRPYRNALPPDVAVTRMQRRSAIQWDPELLMIFERMVVEQRLGGRA